MYCKKILYQAFGSVALIGIQGTAEEIETQFNSFYNFGLCRPGSSLEHWRDDFAVVWTTPDRVNKYCWNSAAAKIHQDNFKFRGAKKRILAEMQERQTWFNGNDVIIRDNELPFIYKNSFNDIMGGKYRTRTVSSCHTDESIVEDLATEVSN
jgi:hypothetical protein